MTFWGERWIISTFFILYILDIQSNNKLQDLTICRFSKVFIIKKILDDSMSKYIRKCNDTYNRKAVIQYSKNNQFIREWKTVGEIYRVLGFDKSAILRCCKGKQKRSYWYIWKFKDDVENHSELTNESQSTIVSQAVQSNEISHKEGN